jgi:hypothetical protein
MVFNYSAQAVRDLKEWSSEADRRRQPKTALSLRTVAELLGTRSVKFALPEGGCLFSIRKPFLADDADLLKLPFPVIALEYFVSRADGWTDPLAPAYAPERICLAWTHEGEGSASGVMVVPLWRASPKYGWVMGSAAIFIPYKQSGLTTDRMYFGAPDSFKGIRSDLKFNLIPLLVEEFDQRTRKLGLRRVAKECYLDAMDEMNALLEFLLALSCTNVSIRDASQQIPERLNKKRLAKGKLPIFTYKTLDIVIPRHIESHPEEANSSRQRPRVHLRRGHIRKLQTGSRIWVNACVVGSNRGIVHKDYRLVSAEGE